MEMKKLYRNTQDKLIAGVCSGLAEYAVIDTAVVRLISAFVIIFTGLFPGALLYIIAAVVMPAKPSTPAAA